MDKQSSSINQWTKGSNNDSKSTQKSDFNNKTASNYNSFEFLDMSSCDETQKLKLKNTLSSPSSFSTQRERYRSNFATRNSSIKPTPQQYSTIQYHANNTSKNQKPNYQFYQTKHPHAFEHDMMRHVSISSRSFSSDANTFSSKNNSNFNNNISSLSNTTNISSKRLDDNRHYPNTQEKLSKWQSTNKKPPYVGLKESSQGNQKDTSVKRKEAVHSYHPLSKELSRDSNKSFPNCNRNMSPPLTNNYQTNTTVSSTTTSSSPSSISMSNQSGQHQAHYNPQIQYGSTSLHPPMYPSGSVPLIPHYQMHPSFMTTVPPGQQMIPPPYGHHGERNDISTRDGNIVMQVQNDLSNPSTQHTMGSNRGSRRGRSRGGNNNMSRRDYHMRQSHQHQQHLNQQSSITSNEYGQPLMEQAQAGGAVMGSGQYQQFYIHYPTYYGGPNAGHLAPLPGSANAANAQNLTGQPLFAIQQPVLYQYGSHFPIMYNMMPSQPHPMAHQQSEMADGDHNQNQESSGANPAAVMQQIPWTHHVAYQEPQQIFHHSPHLNTGEVDLEFQVPHAEEFHLQMMNHSGNFQLIAPDQHAVNMIEEVIQPEHSLQQEEFNEIENESLDEHQLYQQDLSMVGSGNDTGMLVEKTRNLMIQTTPQDVAQDHQRMPDHEQGVDEFNSKSLREEIVPNPHETVGILNDAGPVVTSSVDKVDVESASSNYKVLSHIENKMIVNNKEKPPAWGASTVPNLAAQGSIKKPTAVSVSVSAIPNKDVLHLQQKSSNESVAAAKEQAGKNQDGTLSMISSRATDKDHQQFPTNQTSFSSIIASKQPLSSQTIADSKKTDHKQNDTQHLQKQQQIALSDRAKQQIVTTITGVGASSQEVVKKPELAPVRNSRNKQSSEDLTNTSEKNALQVKTTAPVSSAAASGASWAALFVSPESAAAAKISSPSPSLPTPSPAQPQTPETHKVTAAKNPESLSVQTSPQVPGVMSYSAVSAQSLPASNVNYAASVTTIPSQHAAGDVSSSKKLPQSKLNLPNTNNNNSDNHPKAPPVDQHALKLGDFFSKYKIESNSVSLLPRGLLNKSNYCYINAILQALVACPPFYHLMKSIPQIPTTYRVHTKTPVTDAMVELVSNYSQLPYRKWVPREKNKKDEVPEIARDSAFEPSVILKMLQALRTDMFPVEGRQEDAEEFLSCILNRINDEMIELKKLVEKPKVIPKKEEENGDDVNGNIDLTGDDEEEWQVISGARNKSTITRTTDFGRSPISDIFGGKLRLRVHREGDHSSDNIEPFFTLKLVIEKASSVREALEILVGRDQLEGVTCSRTNQEVAAWQQVTLEELPVVLILHLKCFDFKKESCTKILKTVEFPVELKIDQKIMASKNKYQQKQKQYKLFAVVYHDGKEASKGHYITDVFHVGYSSWIRYDDSTVKAVPESNVLHPKSPRVPYLLFYRRYDTIGGNRERDHNCNNHQINQKPTK